MELFTGNDPGSRLRILAVLSELPSMMSNLFRGTYHWPGAFCTISYALQTCVGALHNCREPLKITIAEICVAATARGFLLLFAPGQS